MADECRPVEVEGVVAMVHGSEPMTEEDRGHFATIVRAVKAKMLADRPTDEQIREWGEKLNDKAMSSLRARSLARRFLGELETERERRDAAEAKLSAVRDCRARVREALSEELAEMTLPGIKPENWQAWCIASTSVMSGAVQELLLAILDRQENR